MPTPEAKSRKGPLATPDGRYIVINGQVWRCANPSLPHERREALVAALMEARRTVRQAKRRGDAAGLRDARAKVNEAKIALGERGPVWWDDGARDWNRHKVANTPYAGWYASLSDEER